MRSGRALGAGGAHALWCSAAGVGATVQGKMSRYRGSGAACSMRSFCENVNHCKVRYPGSMRRPGKAKSRVSYTKDRASRALFCVLPTLHVTLHATVRVTLLQVPTGIHKHWALRILVATQRGVQMHSLQTSAIELQLPPHLAQELTKKSRCQLEMEAVPGTLTGESAHPQGGPFRH